MATPVCRVCLAGNIKMMESSEIELQDINIFEKLTGIKMVTEYCTTEAICYACFAQLLRCRAFSERAHRSDTILRSLSKKGLEASQESLEQLKLSPLEASLPLEHEASLKKQAFEDSYEDIQSDELDVTKPVQLELIFKSHTDTLLKNTNILAKSHEKRKSEAKYRCEVCDVVFSRKYNLQVHRRVHTGEKPYACDKCEQRFTYRGTLIQHKLSHAVKPNVCTRCNDTFANPTELLEHKCTETGKNADEETKKPFACDQCDKTFSRKKLLNGHIRIHADKSYACPHCDKAFPIKVRLDNHLITHSGEKPFTCDRCAKSFSTSASLKHHMIIHSGVRPYSCEKCGKTFARKYEVTLHSRVHTGEKPYSCDCGKTFTQKSSLNVHKRTHSGERPYSCDICTKTFGDKYTLRKHVELHGGGARPRGCGACPRVCTSRSAAYAHRREHAHAVTDAPPPRCDVCHKTFTNNSHLRRHVKNIHGKRGKEG